MRKTEKNYRFYEKEIYCKHFKQSALIDETNQNRRIRKVAERIKLRNTEQTG